MKAYKTILMAGALSLGLASLSQAATTVVRFTGSTAFRAQTNAAILHAFDASPAPVGAGNDTIAKATYAIFSGKINGNDVIVKTDWTGSEAGIKVVANPIAANKIPFLPDAAAALGTTGFYTLTPAQLAANAYVNEQANVAMSDTWQSSSAYYGVSKGYSNLLGGGGFSDGIVGVVAFKWLASSNASITNITGKQAQVLFTAGYIPQSVITGTAADEAKYIYAIGRDSSSGTRLTAVTEIGLGASQPLTQYEPQTSAGAQVSGTGVTIANLVLLDGTSGYTSGGNLAKALANSGPVDSVNGGTVTLVGYAGQTDADGSGQGIAAGAKELAYNGVTLGKPYDYNLIAEGKYTFWGYEHLYYGPGLTGVAKTTADKVAIQIRNGNASNQNIAKDAPHPYLSEMQVERSGDGAKVTSLIDNSPY